MINIKKWLLGSIGVLLLGLSVATLMQPAPAYAVRPDEGGSGGTTAPSPDGEEALDVCGTAGARCNNFIEKYINPFIILLSALVGIAAVISIIFAGIQYGSSADDPAKVTQAKQRIFNTVIGLVAYIFLFAFLNYLVPGGIL